jgi:iron complex outermembrane recepter protein
MRKIFTAAKLGASVFALAACTNAFAQGAPAATDATAPQAATTADEGTPEIVVTAQFRSQKLQDTPIAITAVNAAMLESRGQTDISQVAAQAPNVTLRPQPQNGGSGLIAFIRGVGQTDFNYALDPGVGVYIDDVYIPTLSSSLLELIDLDRVEILRGPQGTLAGKNSIGGAIKLFSAKPTGDNSGSLSVGYGSYHSLNIRGMANFKLSDTLAVRVSGISRSNDGYVGMLDYGLTHPNSNVRANNARGGGNADYLTMGGQNVTALRGALKWEPTSSIEVNLSGDYTRENSEAIPTVLIAAGATVAPGVAFDPRSVANSASFTGAGLNPLLVGRNGQQVNFSCAFVPAGPYSCDTGGNLLGWDPRFVSYSNFVDSVAPTTQAPFKPYFAQPITKFNGWGVHGSVSFDLSDNVNLRYIGSYRAYNSKFGQDQDASPIPIAQLDNELNHHAFSSEVRLNFKAMDSKVEGTVGAFYLDQKGTYTARVDLNYVTPVIDFIHGPDATPSTTKAIFGTVTVHPTEGFSLTGGLRYTKDKKDYTYLRSNPDGTVPNGFACFVTNGVFSQPNCILSGLYNITGKFKGNRTDWRLVADYRFSPQFLAYASASTGFKGGGVNPRPFVSDQALAFNPETITTYEAGFKADLFDRKVRLNGAAFINKYKDITLGKQVCPESSLPAPCLRPANIGSADVKGVELEATIRPAEGFTLDGSFSYLDFKYTTACVAGALAGTAIPCSGITPYTPKTSYSVGAQYDYKLNAGLVSLRVDGSYQGAIYTSSENTFWSRMPGRFVANGQVSFTTDDKDWKATLEVKNLFNRYYFLSVSDVTTNALGAVTGVPAMPRTWALTLKRTF